MPLFNYLNNEENKKDNDFSLKKIKFDLKKSRNKE